MLLRTAAFKKSHLDFGNEDSGLEKTIPIMSRAYFYIDQVVFPP